MKEPQPPQKPTPQPESAEARLHPDGALEDPIHEFWVRHGRSIIGGALLVVIFAGVIFGIRAYRQGQERQIQATYTEAQADGTLADFATTYGGHQLAGIAALRTGHDAYGTGEWEEAARYYQIAIDSLQRTSLAGKARLGLAATHVQTDNREAAGQILSALADDETQTIAARAEAVYFLAILALANNDETDFEVWSEKLAELDPRSFWQQKLRYYQDRVELPVAAPAPIPEMAPTAEGDQ